MGQIRRCILQGESHGNSCSLYLLCGECGENSVKLSLQLIGGGKLPHLLLSPRTPTGSGSRQPESLRTWKQNALQFVIMLEPEGKVCTTLEKSSTDSDWPQAQTWGLHISSSNVTPTKPHTTPPIWSCFGDSWWPFFSYHNLSVHLCKLLGFTDWAWQGLLTVLLTNLISTTPRERSLLRTRVCTYLADPSHVYFLQWGYAFVLIVHC